MSVGLNRRLSGSRTKLQPSLSFFFWSHCIQFCLPVAGLWCPCFLVVVQESMRHWCAMLTSSGEALPKIQIKCGTFQGDALSPLLFCVAFNPLSNILERTGFGYTLKSGQKIHHLLYMDDLKLYGKKERVIDSLINIVRIFSDDIGMKFGLEKCTGLVVERGKVKQTDGLQLNIGNIQDVEASQGYTYLEYFKDRKTSNRKSNPRQHTSTLKGSSKCSSPNYATQLHRRSDRVDTKRSRRT
jgi:hypothetical protein